MLKRIIACALAAFMIAGSLIGCEAEGGASAQAGAEATAEVKEDAHAIASAEAAKCGLGPGQTNTNVSSKDTVVIATAQEPFGQFNQDAEISTNQAKDSPVNFQIYECLYWMDETGTPVPWLATSCEVSEDGKEYTFTIRDDVYFHNGEHLTAEDVAFTYNCAMEHNQPLSTNLFINFDHAEAIDDYTVKCFLTDPFAGFLAELTARQAFIINKKYYDEVGPHGYNDAPVGTGPYKFVERISGQQITLERFDDYYAGPAPIKTIVIKPITNVSTQFVSLKAGDIDVVNIADIASCMQLTEADNCTWISVPSAMRVSMGLNDWPSLDHVTKDLNLRWAIKCAINKDDLVYAVLHDVGSPLDTYVCPGYAGIPEVGVVEGTPYDPEKAKEYLAKSNYNGEVLKCYVNAGTNFDKAAQIIQNQLQQVGINMEVVATDTGTLYAANNAGEYDLNISGTSSCEMDLSSYGTQFRIHNDIPHFEEPYAKQLDDLMIASNLATGQERIDLATQIFTINEEQVYEIGLWNETSTMAYRNGLKGITLNPNNAWRVYNWYWE